MWFSENILFGTMHQDWYICHSKEKGNSRGVRLILDFYSGEPLVLARCSFVLHPMWQGDNKYKNCKNVARPLQPPLINGQPLSLPPRLVPQHHPPSLVLPPCLPVCPAGSAGGKPWLPSRVEGGISKGPPQPYITSAGRKYFAATQGSLNISVPYALVNK